METAAATGTVKIVFKTQGIAHGVLNWYVTTVDSLYSLSKATIAVIKTYLELQENSS